MHWTGDQFVKNRMHVYVCIIYSRWHLTKGPNVRHAYALQSSKTIHKTKNTPRRRQRRRWLNKDNAKSCRERENMYFFGQRREKKRIVFNFWNRTNRQITSITYVDSNIRIYTQHILWFLKLLICSFLFFCYFFAFCLKSTFYQVFVAFLTYR